MPVDLRIREKSFQCYFVPYRCTMKCVVVLQNYLTISHELNLIDVPCGALSRVIPKTCNRTQPGERN